ncbi:hypothetical protein TNCV_4760671 [Trichonephila clavipes]|uniref:Uncharacterized protein n=1 Tax=Trichonephila clavipes TaxID=2585209 RepID=A0A8X6RDV5_TRICX|nr:hypothetical protein TNCV_4760671 [Trichonephila clavipes]
MIFQLDIMKKFKAAGFETSAENSIELITLLPLCFNSTVITQVFAIRACLNPELQNTQVPSTRFPPLLITETQTQSVLETDEIGIVIEEVVEHSRQLNLEADCDEVRELLDSHKHDLKFEEFIKIHG